MPPISTKASTRPNSKIWTKTRFCDRVTSVLTFANGKKLSRGNVKRKKQRKPSDKLGDLEDRQQQVQAEGRRSIRRGPVRVVQEYTMLLRQLTQVGTTTAITITPRCSMLIRLLVRETPRGWCPRTVLGFA